MDEMHGNNRQPGQQHWTPRPRPGEPRSTTTSDRPSAPEFDRIGPASDRSDRTVRALESELRRKDRLLEDVIEQYERLLTERNRQVTTRTDGGSPIDSSPTGIRGLTERIIDRFRS